MRPDTKRHYYFGVGFIVAPAPVFSAAALLKFEARLADPNVGITFDNRQRDESGTSLLVRNSPPLTVHLTTPAPQVGQLAVMSVEPRGLPEEFISDAEDIVQAFRDVWPGPFQVVHRDCTVRYLYAVGGEHSFQYLWEKRLHQASGELQLLERPILGGGIRFVLPPQDAADEAIIEVKIESLLRDPSQLFVESQFAWRQPTSPEIGFDAGAMIEAVEAYTNGPLTRFILPEQSHG